MFGGTTQHATMEFKEEESKSSYNYFRSRMKLSGPGQMSGA